MIKRMYLAYASKMEMLKDLSPLLFRLVLAYGFLEPAMNKLQDIHAIGEWFQSMNLPAPFFQAYMATFVESFGVVLLILGLGTRVIAIPLIITMIVAIKTVHWENGFAAGNNGFEIPFYYIIMLVSLMLTGSGRISLDHFISKKFAQ